LISFGGGDFPNASLIALEALDHITDFDLDVSIVVGSTNPHYASLLKAAKASRHQVIVLRNVENMAAIMGEADLGITASGGTCYELAFLGVPMFLIAIATNQERSLEALVSAKAAAGGGGIGSLDREALAASIRNLICDPWLRKELVENARKVIDGKGAERIVHEMLAFDELLAEGRELQS